MSSPRHSPPPSAAAPRPKGILKNVSDSSGTLPQVQGVGSGKSPEVDENGNRLAWDESNLTLHEIERETQAARMKIDEPKTPFVRSASLGPMDEDTNFDLDSQGGPSYFPEGSNATTAAAAGTTAGTSGDATATQSGTAAYAPPSTSGGRRTSAAEQLAANTMANAGRRSSNAGSATSSSGGGGASMPPVAVGLDSADLAASGGSGSVTNSRRSDSRSPSFTLPSSRRSSAAGERSRDGVREEMRNRDDAMQGVEQDENAFGEDEGEALDPEAKAKQAAFAQKRNAHYGNEAEAMKVAAALAAQEDEDDDEEEEQESLPPPVPSLPNGRVS